MLETDHAQDAKFRENFFRDFAGMVEKYPAVSELHLTQAVLTDQKEGIKVKSLEKCDFEPMFEYFEGEKEKKKSMTAEQKKAYVFRQSHRI